MTTQPATRPIELLAPAGGPDALIAAVNNGADAVYLGLGELNARRGADNFDLGSLAQGARFAHLRGARVYLTANVVVLEHEMSSALEMVDAAWAAGVDAVIVQDLGLLHVIREALPDVRLHASTQIDAMNTPTVRMLADLGVSRVTLARELSLAEIAACAATGVEVETFIHGALCYCYSGQCLMSSMIGRRSANRGLCAQPCRLPYELLSPQGEAAASPGRYLLSPKDAAGIAHLPELIGAGVAALKIEGRMKAPEYVAIVTGVYRAALDRALADPEGYVVTDAEWGLLEEAFNRGFTDAYLRGSAGSDLMSYQRPNNRGVRIGRVTATASGSATIMLERSLDPADTIEFWTRSGRFAQPAGRLAVGDVEVPVAPAGSAVSLVPREPVSVEDRVFRVANAAMIEAARRTFRGGGAIEHRPQPVTFSLRLKVGQPLRLVAESGGATVAVEASPVGVARTKPVTLGEVVEHVGRLGGSGYRAVGWDVELDADAGIGYSALHAIRREALERLDEVRLRPWAGRTRQEPSLPRIRTHGVQPRQPAIVATAWDEAVAHACLEAGADRVFVRTFTGQEAAQLGAGVSPALPRVVRDAEQRALSQQTGQAAALLIANLGDLADRSRPTRIEADWPLNAVNPWTTVVLGDLGADLVWASPELSGRQLAELCQRSPVAVGCVIWGRQELMVSQQCVLESAGACGRRCSSCARRRGWWRLRDQKGYEFPVTTDSLGRSHILNAVTLDLTRALGEIVAAGVAAVRLDFSEESPQRAAEVVRSASSAVAVVAAGGPPPEMPLAEPATSGHFYRGLR